MFERLFESRARVDVTNPRDPILAQWFGGGSNTAAGVNITPETAMQLSAVFACVRILSSAVASLPLDLYRRVSADERERATEHPLYAVLHDQPSAWQTAFEFREMQMGHLLLRGNAYALVERDGSGRVTQLLPLHPDRMRPFRAPNGKVAYEYREDSGTPHIYLQDEIYHLRGLSFDGLVGVSPITYARETIGLSVAAEQFGGAYFGNGTVLGGVLEHPGKLGDKAYENLKEYWEARHRGGANAHKPAILEEGMKWTALGVKPEEAQFLETRKFQVAEVARLFGVPPHMIADVDGSTSWGSGIEQQGIGFVVYSLRPWLVRIEQAIKRDLITAANKRTLYAEHNVDGLLRGDSAARAQFYKEMWQVGAYSPNDIRRKENDAPIDGGDTYYVPVNFAPIGSQPPAQPGADEAARSRLEAAHRKQFADAIDRVVTCEVKALRRALNGAGDLAAFDERATQFYRQHGEFMRRALGTAMGAEVGGYIREHIGSAVAELKAARDESEQAVRDLLDTWDNYRAAEITAAHAERALRGVTDGD